MSSHNEKRDADEDVANVLEKLQDAGFQSFEGEPYVPDAEVWINPTHPGFQLTLRIKSSDREIIVTFHNVRIDARRVEVGELSDCGPPSEKPLVLYSGTDFWDGSHAIYISAEPNPFDSGDFGWVKEINIPDHIAIPMCWRDRLMPPGQVFKRFPELVSLHEKAEHEWRMRWDYECRNAIRRS